MPLAVAPVCDDKLLALHPRHLLSAAAVATLKPLFKPRGHQGATSSASRSTDLGSGN